MKRILVIAMMLAGIFSANEVMAQRPEGGQRPQPPQMVNHSDTPAGKGILALSASM